VKQSVKRIKWSVQDDATIVSTMDRTAADVAALLNRTVHSVEYHRSKLQKASAITRRDRPGSIALRTWTPDEDAIVVATIDQRVRLVAKMIPMHTAQAIMLRRRELRTRSSVDLDGLRNPRAPQPWTEEEDAVVRRRTADPLISIATDLDRSIAAVAHRRYKLRDRDRQAG